MVKAARLGLLLGTIFVVAQAVGCGHDLESPAVTSDPPGTSGQPGPAAPDLVCVEQLTTKVTLHGGGFTPFPSQTLQSTVQLLLPTVALKRTTALDGTPATGDATVADDVNDIAHSHVSWTSEMEMAFDVSPDLALAPGLYDITVANRDGVHSATFPGAIAGVPRPTVKTASPDILCDAQDDQIITLSGTDLLDVGGKLPTVAINGKTFPISKLDACSDVPGNHAAGKVRSCKTGTFTIPKGSFEPGQIKLILTNPAPASCASTDAIALTVVPPPTVAGIVPDVLCDAQGDIPMNVSGTGFLQIGDVLPIVRVGTQNYNATKVDGCAPVAGPFVEGAVQSCTKLSFAVQKGTLPSGNYDVAVTNPPPAACRSVEKLTVAVVDPPTVSSIAADLVCDAQGDQNMVLTGTGFVQIGTALPSVKVGTETFTPTAIDGCTPVVGTFTEQPVTSCTTLKFTIPKGKLAEGDYAIVVTNPQPADCASSEAVKLHVAPPPAVTGAAQLAICDAQAAQTVNVQGTGFLTLTTGATTTYPKVTINNVSYTPSAASGCAPVTGTFLEGQAQECTGLTIQIAQNALTAGTYPITVTNPAPAACTIVSSVSLTVEPPPSVTSVTPATVCAGGGQVTVAGQGFIATPTVVLQSTGNPSLTATGVTVNAGGTQAVVTVPAGGIPSTTSPTRTRAPIRRRTRRPRHKSR